MSKLEINVTEADIKNGGRYGNSCPVALAILRASGRRQIHVTRTRVFRNISQSRVGTHLTELPRNAQDWIMTYDASQRVQPFTFKLDWPLTIKKA